MPTFQKGRMALGACHTLRPHHSNSLVSPSFELLKLCLSSKAETTVLFFDLKGCPQVVWIAQIWPCKPHIWALPSFRDRYSKCSFHLSPFSEWSPLLPFEAGTEFKISLFEGSGAYNAGIYKNPVVLRRDVELGIIPPILWNHIRSQHAKYSFIKPYLICRKRDQLRSSL